MPSLLRVTQEIPRASHPPPPAGVASPAPRGSGSSGRGFGGGVLLHGGLARGSGVPLSWSASCPSASAVEFVVSSLSHPGMPDPSLSLEADSLRQGFLVVFMVRWGHALLRSRELRSAGPVGGPGCAPCTPQHCWPGGKLRPEGLWGTQPFLWTLKGSPWLGPTVGQGWSCLTLPGLGLGTQ